MLSSGTPALTLGTVREDVCAAGASAAVALPPPPVAGGCALWGRLPGVCKAGGVGLVVSSARQCPSHKRPAKNCAPKLAGIHYSSQCKLQSSVANSPRDPPWTVLPCRVCGTAWLPAPPPPPPRLRSAALLQSPLAAPLPRWGWPGRQGRAPPRPLVRQQPGGTGRYAVSCAFTTWLHLP